MIYFRIELLKIRFLKILALLCFIIFLTKPAFAENSASGSPVNVIFDTDMCIDDDDGMALAIVHALHSRREANLVAVTVNLDEKWCASYADVINTFYGHPDIPIGTMRNGLGLKESVDIIFKALGLRQLTEKQINGINFAKPIAERKNPDGSLVYPHRLKDASQAPEAVSLLRKILVAQANKSVVMIQVGNAANFAALLKSPADSISDLTGHDLVKNKVQFLSIMAGSFNNRKSKDSFNVANGGGINNYEHIASAQKVFGEWPTQIVVSGGEIGGTIMIPGSSIERDFSYVKNHPIAEAYRHICAGYLKIDDLAKLLKTDKCPHDHHTADPTATLYALRPNGNYFSLSKPGTITVLPDGSVRFDENPHGQHRYLTVSEEQKVRAQEAMTLLISQPPLKR